MTDDRIKELEAENADLKQRINKAILYISEWVGEMYGGEGANLNRARLVTIKKELERDKTE